MQALDLLSEVQCCDVEMESQLHNLKDSNGAEESVAVEKKKREGLVFSLSTSACVFENVPLRLASESQVLTNLLHSFHIPCLIY
jgi:hypothetical protein